jgi:predicted metal-dependent peptidase
MPTIPMPPAQLAVICHGPPTAAVDGRNIYYNEAWVNSLPEKARMGLLAHEVLHPALGHLWRRGGRNIEVWNYAVDFAANDIIKRMIPNVELPEGGCYDSRFQGMAAEQIYTILEKEVKRRPDRKNGDGHVESPIGEKGKCQGKKGDGKKEGGKGNGAGQDKKGKGGGGKKEQEKDGGAGDAQKEADRQREEAERKGGQGKGEEDQGDEEGQGEGDGQGEGGEPDDGENEGGEGPAPNVQREGCGGKNEHDEGEVDDLDVPEENLEQHWKDVLIQAAMVAKSKGNLPGQLARLVEDVTAPRVPWQQIIEQFLTEVLRDDYDMLKQDRRFIEQGIYFPDLQSNATNVAVAVDTSGSIGKKELVAFVSEMAGILRCRGIANMRVFACDAEVTLDETIGPTDPLPDNYPGGGGTDFRGVFKRLEESARSGDRPALLVYFTDMCGTFPDKDVLGIPTIWLAAVNAYMKEENLPTPPFGVVIPYEIEEGDRD